MTPIPTHINHRWQWINDNFWTKFEIACTSFLKNAHFLSFSLLHSSSLPIYSIFHHSVYCLCISPSLVCLFLLSLSLLFHFCVPLFVLSLIDWMTIFSCLHFIHWVASLNSLHFFHLSLNHTLLSLFLSSLLSLSSNVILSIWASIYNCNLQWAIFRKWNRETIFLNYSLM